MIANHVVDRMLATRGPMYRRICARIADIVGESPITPVGLADGASKAQFRAGFVAGCKAVAAEIRKIDDEEYWRQRGLR